MGAVGGVRMNGVGGVRMNGGRGGHAWGGGHVSGVVTWVGWSREGCGHVGVGWGRLGGCQYWGLWGVNGGGGQGGHAWGVVT